MIFKRKNEQDDLQELLDRVDRLQVEALQCRVPGQASIALNHAGDLLLRTGDLLTALELYGRAVDNLVEADRFEAATALCRKIIRTAPAVVRARCTLTWLAIGAGFNAEVEQRVCDYIFAAEFAGRQKVAAAQLKCMSSVVDVHDVRMMLGDYLLYLGDDRGADALFGEVFEERNRGTSRYIDRDKRWRDVRKAALTTIRTAA
jgi:hypothetical protein